MRVKIPFKTGMQFMFANSIFNLFKKRPSDETAGAAVGKSGIAPKFIEKYGLTSRQADVAGAMLLGLRDREIAVLLDIRTSTVKTHIKHIYQKTGAHGRYELMILAGNR